MAKRILNATQSAQMTKTGKPRSSKHKKGNAPARTSRSGNGKKIR
jgi:hypothetical protein